MEKNKELAKNTMIITIGKVCTQFISFLLLPLYTTQLSTEEYGVIDLVSTYVQLLLPVVILQMDQALLRFLIAERNGKKNIGTSISTVSAFFIFQISVFTIIYYISQSFINNKYAIYLYLTLITTGLSSFMLQAVRGFGDNVTYSISSFLCGLITILLNIFFIVRFHMKAEGMLLAGIIGNFIAAGYAFIKDKIYRYIDLKHIDISVLKNMLKYAIPLVPNALIWWIVNASDRSIVLFFLGTSANGILAIAHKFPTLISTFYNIFHISWTESAVLHLKEEDRDKFFTDVFDTVYRIFAAASICLISLMPFIFNLVINERYAEAYYQIPIYTLASLFNVIVGLYSVIYISEMKTGEIAKTSVLSGIVNIIVNIGLIKFIGIYAASVSSAVSFGVMAIYRAIDVRKYIRQKINLKILISSTVILAITILAYYTNVWGLKIIAAVVALIYSAIINMRVLYKIGYSIKDRIKE